MDWYDKLYIGETVKNRKDRIVRRIEREDSVSKIYLIITARGEQNQLEILTPAEYYKQRRRTGESLVVGLAGSMGEAAELIRTMTEEVYGVTGHANLKEYFEQRQKG